MGCKPSSPIEGVWTDEPSSILKRLFKTPVYKGEAQVVLPKVRRPVHVIRTIPTDFGYPVFSHLKMLRSNAQQIAMTLNRVYQGQDVQFITRGTSGVLIAAEIQRNLESVGFITSIRHVRKPNENHHGGNTPFKSDARLIIVDDHISSGYTMREIAKDLESYRVVPGTTRVDQVDAVVAFHSEQFEEMLTDLFPKMRNLFV